MTKAISLKILTLYYGGESIGNNIVLEVGEKSFPEQIIKSGSGFTYDQLVEEFRGVNEAFQIPIKIKVTEKDWLWSDVGEIIETIHIDPNALPQTFEFKVTVNEKNRLTNSKATAVFTITLEAKEFNPTYPRPRPYKNFGKKNYNRFDNEIAEAVGYWNDEFLNQEYSPIVPLDPDLVKAMIYVESEFGYYIRRKTVRNPHPYPSYPDVMQVADQDNDAIYALHNVYNPNKHKMGTEYEVFNSQLKVFEYKEANGAKYAESIHWGVRYLYHLAQKNIPVGNSWKREWWNWEEIFPEYNGGGDKKYKEKVLKIYKEGKILNNKKVELWSILGLIIFGLGSTFGLHVGLHNYNNAILNGWQTASVIQSEFSKASREAYIDQYNSAVIANAILETFRKMNADPLKSALFRTFTKEDQDEIEDVETIPYDSSLFATIVEYEKDWWEDFDIGRYKNGKVEWLELEGWPEKAYMENSILSVKWINLKGINAPVLEVYGTTHMGNGDMYLFKVSGNKYSLIFATRAVSGFGPTGNSPSQDFKKYGYADCQETFKDGKLIATYKDLNTDGISDLILTGTNEVICDYEFVVDTISIKEKFILNPDATCSVDKYLIFRCK